MNKTMTHNDTAVRAIEFDLADETLPIDHRFTLFGNVSEHTPIDLGFAPAEGDYVEVLYRYNVPGDKYRTDTKVRSGTITFAGLWADSASEYFRFEDEDNGQEYTVHTHRMDRAEAPRRRLGTPVHVTLYITESAVDRRERHLETLRERMDRYSPADPEHMSVKQSNMTAVVEHNEMLHASEGKLIFVRSTFNGDTATHEVETLADAEDLIERFEETRIEARMYVYEDGPIEMETEAAEPEERTRLDALLEAIREGDDPAEDYDLEHGDPVRIEYTDDNGDRVTETGTMTSTQVLGVPGEAALIWADVDGFELRVIDGGRVENYTNADGEVLGVDASFTEVGETVSGTSDTSSADGDAEGDLMTDGGTEVDGDAEADEWDANSFSCPSCQRSGFDGQGHTHTADGTRMYQMQCWTCGLTFAVEDDAPLIPDGGTETDPNPPAGDTTDRSFSDEEIRDLIRGAELLRYSPGTGEHEGNVMAVFRTPGGRGIGLTMADESTTPDELIGETVRETRPFVRGSGVNYNRAFINFVGNEWYDKIVVKNTQNLGVYEVELGER